MPAPWAYLLQLPVGSGSIALEYPEMQMSKNGQNYFSVHRCAFGNPKINDLCGVCFINGVSIKQVCYIEHGSKISVPVVGLEYIFVDCDTSDRILRPIGLNETHAIGQVLGTGGFGTVVLCFDKITTSPLALKVMNRGSDREKEILETLNHPHIVHTQFFKNVGKKTFIGMDYMAGGDLSSFVGIGKFLTEDQAKLIFYQVVDAVSYLHDKGICHRDLKPANILLTHSRPHTLVKVTDLGISKSEIMHGPMNTSVGTAAFMAPETLSPNYSKKVDVWSLGVILYLSLTGRYISMNELDFHALGANRSVTKLIKHMLQIQPSRRASITDVACHEWLQDENMKREVAKLKIKYQNTKRVTTRVNVTQHERLKQVQDEGGFPMTLSFLVGGLVFLSFSLFWRSLYN